MIEIIYYIAKLLEEIWPVMSQPDTLQVMAVQRYPKNRSYLASEARK